MSIAAGLEKIRALDLSMGWAGPLVTEMLAEMGVQVIKVEDTRNFDWWRGSLSMGPPEMQPVERSSVFNTANRGKLGLTLDLSRPEGVAILKRLAAASDILVENFSPGTIGRLGLGWPELSALNPRLIMISLPAFGSEGPESNARGYGMTIEAMAGVTALTAYHDGGAPYMLSNALGDPVSGLHGMLAVLAALHQRARTGRGQLVEVAEVETVVPFVTGALLEYQLSGRTPIPLGNRHSTAAPHGIFRCADDTFIALGVHNEDHWRALTDALELSHLAEDPRFASADARKHNEDALEAELRPAILRLGADAAASRLIAAGVPAGQVNSSADVLADRQIGARSFFVPIDRAVVGTHLYPGAIARLSATPLDAGRPSPMLGEHNESVLREMLAMSDAEIARLAEDGIIGSHPRSRP